MSAQICPSCLSRQFEAGRCAKCGFVSGEYKPAPTALSMGSMVGAYRIGMMKANSRQSQIYTAVHAETSQPVILEEFFPAKVAGRTQGNPEVVLTSADDGQIHRYEQGCLLIEASAQKRPLKRLAAFRANNTVYGVFEPVATRDIASQCEMLADNPVFFRDQNGQPMMSINTLLIPDMPKERKYEPLQYQIRGPITSLEEERDYNYPETVITAAKKTGVKRKIFLFGGIGAASIMIAVLAVGILSGWFGGGKNAQVTPTPEITEIVASIPTEPVKDSENEPADNPDDHTGENAPDITEEDTAPDYPEGGLSGDGNQIVNDDADLFETVTTDDETQDSEPAEPVVPGSEPMENESGNEPDDTVAEESEEPDIQLTAEEFMKRLRVVSLEEKGIVEARELKSKAKTVDDLLDRKKKTPTKFKSKDYPLQVVLFGAEKNLIHESGENNKLYVVIKKGSAQYRVPFGEKETLAESEIGYSAYNNVVLSFELWQNIGEAHEGAAVYFPESAISALTEDIDHFLNKPNTMFGLKKENDELKLVISSGDYSIPVYLWVPDAEKPIPDDNETQEEPDKPEEDGEAEQEPDPAPSDNDPELEQNGTIQLTDSGGAMELPEPDELDGIREILIFRFLDGKLQIRIETNQDVTEIALSGGDGTAYKLTATQEKDDPKWELTWEYRGTLDIEAGTYTISYTMVQGNEPVTEEMKLEENDP